ncbi:hypothetical protein [Stenotrophomonas nitritireducens]|uniref:hypothetical protein n=1 Tax=Stenotrophomonas nitritireducens TaxID=83617 RepID=UPI003D99CE98
MSAVFTGNGLGLFNTSLSQLGYGLGGGAGVGQGRDNQYVNAATGNLVWQSSDEHLVFRGLSVNLTRTYNSLGLLSEVGADGWMTGFERRVALQGGTFNAAGSVMRRFTGDGSYQDFAYVSANTYRSSAGDGAHDTLTWTGSDWRYVEGSTRREEGYAGHADAVRQGRLTYLRDLRSDGALPVTWQVDYDASQRIAQIRADDGGSGGDALVFGYDGAGRLSSIATREGGVVRHQVAYEYDGQGRLVGVVTDLTPNNAADNTWNGTTASQNDGRLFRTQYTYEGTSLRLASVRQGDGTVVGFTYHADGRIKTVTRGDTNANDADGLGETFTYAYAAGSTTVSDSLGRAWVYGFDAEGQLTSLVAPAISGQSDVTTYQYDASGNVLQVKTVRGAAVLSQVDYAYDASGNVTWEWDGLGNAISRTWSAGNQLLSLTRYTGVDPDREGAALPTGGLTTRYVYDGQDRLRFVVDALGQVSEFSYAASGDGIGQQSSLRQYLGASYAGTSDLAGLEAWATAARKASSQLTELGYDAWGRLSLRTEYATVNASGIGVLDSGASLTRYTYDAQGTLRQQITLRNGSRTGDGAALAGSQQIDYAYDGLGRLLSSTSREIGVSGVLQTTYAYLDSGHQVVMTEGGGRVVTQTRDAAGRLVSVSEQGNAGGGSQTRTQLNYYDASGQLRASEDAAGGRSYFFYDAKGRLEATVDATGALTRTYYDGSDRVVGTRQYANRLTTGSWLVAGKVLPTQVDSLGIVTNASLDRVSGRTYDAAGRLATQTDGLEGSTERSISTYTYDGAGRLLQVRTTDAAGTAGTARVVRYFHDEAGRQVGVLDAEGYLTETQYDRGGRVLSLTRYASASPTAYRATGTLAQLRPGTTGQDQTTRYFHDGRGQLVGLLDAQGYLTEYVIDETWSVRAERRYATAVTAAAGDTLATVRAQAGTYQQVRRYYDGQGRLAIESNAEGTQTRYTYDAAGRLVKTETAQGTSEVREGNRRYNAFGELIGEISGEGALQLLPGMSEAQLDAIYAQYGVRHSYDVLGRRIESIDAAGNKTWYFHDSAGRLTFTVKGMADEVGLQNARGEVTETRYTAFGDVSDTIAYTGRLTIPVPGSRASAANAISTLAYAAAVDTRRQYAYTARGQLAQVIDAENAVTTYAYTAFGDLSRVVAASGTASASTTDHVYDRRGHLTQRTEGVGSGSVRSVGFSYDAFGRVIGEVDGRGTPTAYGYDRLGRQISVTRTVQGRVETVSTTYDAYRRTQVTDARGMVTTYAYDPATQVMTVTSAEGIQVSTAYNRHGQVLTVTDAAGRVVTRNTYDRDGLLTSTSDALNQASTQTYDARGLLTATVDASGRRVEFRYDAQGRLLQRIEDPGAGKLNITTNYRYDGQGRQLTVTDASGRVTGYSYDREGRLAQVAQDPAGLNQCTVFAYDAQGRQVTVTEGYGTAAATVRQYLYDALGRRTAEVVDPGAGKLNLTTSYAYDGNGNVIRRTDATGAVTRYYYDEANRQTYAVDPLGGLTRNWYDANGRLVATRSAAQALTPAQLASLGDATTVAQLDALRVEGAADAGRYLAYDNDGRLRYSIDLTGAVEQSLYDSAGRLIRTRAHVNRVELTPVLVGQLRAGTATVTTVGSGEDQVTWSVLDEAGRVRYSIDRAGNVQETGYDAAGRVAWTRAYATALVLDSALTVKLNAGTTQLSDVSSRLTTADDRDLRLYRIHDAAGRLRFSVDAYGALQKHFTDPAGRDVGSRRYAPAVVMDAALLAKLADGTATEQDIAARLGSDNARDLQTYQVYDDAGRVRFIIDIVGDAAGNMHGAVTELFYDASGRVVGRASRETLVDAAVLTSQLPQVRAGTLPASTVAGWLSGASRTTQWVYDAAGRERYTLRADGNGVYTVQERRYDAAGRVVAETVYGVTIPSATALTVEGVNAALVAANGNTAANQRTTRMVYDANGAVRFVLDNLGGVTEQRYDALGRVVAHRRYPVTIPTSTPATEAAVVAAVADQPASSLRITRTGYDSAGRVAWVMDANGATESFEYDAVGNRIRYTNKLGHVWTYAYDAAGRMVSQASPPVSIATSDNAGNVSHASRAVVTLYGYDALGNLVARTEDATGTQPRITEYQYDNRGNQIRTILPDAGVLNAATGAITPSGVRPTIEVTYNALNQAVVQKDVNGNYSYKAYDSRGQLAYEVDAEGYVTGYTYSTFGEQATLTRYADKLVASAISGWSEGMPLAAAQVAAGRPAGTMDRTLTTRYDALGRKTEVTQSSVYYYQADGTRGETQPTTRFRYNAFGELARTAVLLDPVAGRWSPTYQYYDGLGRNILTVDAEGYVTQRTHDAMGQVTQVIEHARALDAATFAALTPTTPPPPLPAAGDAAIGHDRVFAYGYDALGRKTSEALLRHYRQGDGTAVVGDVRTAFAYDAAGRLTGVTRDAGTAAAATTITEYDALDRTVSVREPERAVLADTAEAALLGSTSNTLGTGTLYQQVSPYVTMAYDAFGNLVTARRYANGWMQGATAPVADAGRDQVMVTRYDGQGRAVWEKDAEGNVVIRSFDAADRLLSTSHTLTNGDGSSVTITSTAIYDKLGRQLSRLVMRDAARDTGEAVAYNAFGDIISRGPGAGDQRAFYAYDRAGRLESDNATGATRWYGYDAAGNQVKAWHNLDASLVATTLIQTDRLGRATQVRSPSNQADATITHTSSRTYDRWGNLLRLVDAKGLTTDYEYDELGNLVREIQPLVRVVANGTPAQQMRPERNWYYDGIGRLVGERDGNGNLSRYEYDLGGRQVKVIDAAGNVRQQAYNALGQQVLSQNGLGYLTHTQYDRLDRVVGHGDYLTNAAGTAREKKTRETCGPSTPSLPYIQPPSGHRCSGLVNVLSLVVSYVVGAVVTVYAGPYAGAAAQGAVRAHSQQTFQAMADGQYDWSRLGRNLLQPFSGNKYDMFDPLGAPVDGGIDYRAVGVSSAVSVASVSVGKLGEAFKWGGYTTIAAQAATSYAANYQFSKWAGYDVSWSNRQLVTSVGAAMVSQREFGDSGVDTKGGTYSQVPSTAFSWREVATAAMQNVGRSAMQYGIGKAVGAPGTHWNNGDVLADAFGNALGSALGASTKARQEERQKLQQMGAQAEAHREQLLGMMFGQSGAQGAGSAGFDSTDTFRDRYPYALASNGGMSSGRGGASFPGAVDTRRSAALTANTRPVEDIPTLDPVYAVPDIHSSGGWYFYSWNSAGQRWVDPRKSVINPAVEDWSMPPHQWLNAYGMSKDGGWKMPGIQVAGPGLANRNLPVWASARPSLKVASAAELPAIENMYTPRVGAWERAYQDYVQGMSDPNLGWVGQGLGLLGAVGTAIPMMADSMISGLWNAPNNAGIAGQKFAQASMLTGHERNIALLEGGLSFTFGFLGVGDVVTLGQSGIMVRTARISSEMPIGGVADNGLELARAKDLAIAADAHAYTKHGGWVTDPLLQERAWTGIAPGSTTPSFRYPSTSSAFHSDELLEFADSAVRSSGILEARLAANPAQEVFKINPSMIGDLGVDLGRGYIPVRPFEPIGLAYFQGPLLRVDNMSSVNGVYRYNPATQNFDMITLYPAVKK